MSTSQDKWGVDRSDDDTWDIVSSVGYTALLVAGWRALHAVSDHPLVRDDYAKYFIAASADPFRLTYRGDQQFRSRCHHGHVRR